MCSCLYYYMVALLGLEQNGAQPVGTVNIHRLHLASKCPGYSTQYSDSTQYSSVMLDHCGVWSNTSLPLFSGPL